jgi:hypothetical protein
MIDDHAFVQTVNECAKEHAAHGRLLPPGDSLEWTLMNPDTSHAGRIAGDVRVPAQLFFEPVPSTYSSDRFTPPAAGIRDGVHLRVALPPPCPGSVAARSETRVRL